MKRYMYLFLLFIVLVAGFFRFFDISNNPPGLYVDEVANGNDAYAILTTGKDMHGVPFPLAFQSLGDYKMPLYIYMTAASMAIFGKNELAVRFPSAIAGTLTVLVFYFFLFELLTLGSHTIISKQTAQKIALLGAFLLAISPWHIHFSRGGFEVTLATFFFLAACWLALLFYKKQSIIYLTISFLLFGSSIYTYFSFKVLSPIIFLFLTIFFYNKYRKLRAKIMFLFILLIFFLLPAILFSFTNNGLQRFSDTSAFSEYPAKTIIKKAVVYPMVFVKNYFSFFSFNFLFRYGDQNGRHQIPNTGLLFWWQLPLLLAGLFSLLHSKQKALKYILLGLLIIVPIPAAFARPSPHTLRSLPLVLPITMIVAIGLYELYKKIRINKKILTLVFSFIIFFTCASYIFSYYVDYPKTNLLDWGGAFRQVVLKSSKLQNQYDYIVVDKNLGNASEYFSFYNQKLHPYYVDVHWIKPKNWNGKKVLYIRPNYGPTTSKDFLENIYLLNQNHDVFAQFFTL